MALHDIPDISHRLTTDVFSTACILQQQVYTLEERCRTSEEREESLRQRRTELQEILSMFATVERTEARATAELAQTLARLRNAGGSTATHSGRRTSSHSYFQVIMETPPSKRATQRGSWPSYKSGNSMSSPLARLARDALPPQSSSPRSPLRPSGAGADPRVGGEGAASQPLGALTSTPRLTPMVGAEAALMRALQVFTSDRERGVGQPEVPVRGGPGPQSASVASVAGARERTDTPTRGRRPPLDPRQQTVTLGSHVVLPARSGSDIAVISEPESDSGAPDGEYSPTDTAPSVPAALPERLDERVGKSITRRVDRLGEHEIAPASAPEGEARAEMEAAEPRAQPQGVWGLIKSVGKSGTLRDAAVNFRKGGGGGYNGRKARSPAHSRLFRSRGKASIVGAPDLLLRISRRRAPIARRQGAGNHDSVDVSGEDGPNAWTVAAAESE
ncbi:hypothetical protein OH77DRAFT_965127 [Trametes cingulata]|nr:hypothetical protein OH77DRAFT_965127 [Trametes cingulata]